jgi:hypothetical protein
MKRYKIKVKALWCQNDVGLCGYIGAILDDGTPIALCSRGKFDLGNDDSLRSGWKNDTKDWGGDTKSFYFDLSQITLKSEGFHCH